MDHFTGARCNFCEQLFEVPLVCTFYDHCFISHGASEEGPDKVCEDVPQLTGGDCDVM